jgi:predicted Zn finger-like uncharacterized protein
MALATTCPQCKTSFKVVPDQLKLRRGLVRCGVCQHVFSGIDYLRYVDDSARMAQRAAAAPAPARGEAPAPAPADAQPPAASPPPTAGTLVPLPPGAAPPIPDSLVAPRPAAPPIAGPQTIIDSGQDLKTAFFIVDSGFGTDAAAARAAQVPLGPAADFAVPAPGTPARLPAPHDPRAAVPGPDPSDAVAAAEAVARAVPAAPFFPDTGAVHLPAVTGAPTVTGAPAVAVAPAASGASFAAGAPAAAEAPAVVEAPEAPATTMAAPAADMPAGEWVADRRTDRVPADRAAHPPDDADTPAIDYFGTGRGGGSALGLALSPAAWAAAALLTLALVAQALIGWRDAIAAGAPALAPALGAVLAPLGLDVGPPRDLDALTIESFELQANGQPDQLQLTAVLRNRGDRAVRFPAMELTLTDSAGALLARKAILPETYLAPAGVPPGGLPARTERPLRLVLQHRGLAPTGYSVALFHP